MSLVRIKRPAIRHESEAVAVCLARAGGEGICDKVPQLVCDTSVIAPGGDGPLVGREPLPRLSRGRCVSTISVPAGSGTKEMTQPCLV